MKIPVHNLDNKKVRDVEVPDAVFAYPYKEHLIHTAVRANRAAKRSGSHKAKGRHEVDASNRKLYRQKGTGRSRAGRSSSPLRRGGGVAHGPRPRDYDLKFTPRDKRNALKSALSRKLQNEEFLVLETLDLESHRTKDLLVTLEALGINGKALLVDDYFNDNLGLASRNVPRLKAIDASGVTVYDVVDRTMVIVSENALNRLVEVLQK